MDEMVHFNAFCELFQKLEVVYKNKGRGSEEGTKIIGVMQFHYRMLTDPMYKYLDKFSRRLVELGYSFVADPGISIDENEVAEAAKVAGKFDFASLVHERKPGDGAHDGQKTGAVFNYNEFSKSIVELPRNEFENIKKKTIDNIKFEQACFENPDLKNKMRAKFRQPKKWALADNAKDW